MPAVGRSLPVTCRAVTYPSPAARTITHHAEACRVRAAGGLSPTIGLSLDRTTRLKYLSAFFIGFEIYRDINRVPAPYHRPCLPPRAEVTSRARIRSRR